MLLPGFAAVIERYIVICRPDACYDWPRQTLKSTGMTLGRQREIRSH